MSPFPHLVYAGYTTEAYPEVERWCWDNIGEWNQEWAKLCDDITAMAIIPDYRSTYYFRTEQQLAFTLRWS